MTGAARGDVSPVCLSVRRVTAKARDVSIQSRRNREPDTTPIRPVTSSTSSTCGSVLRMIESRIETPQRRKRFNRSALNIPVTDSADLTCLIRELLRMTARARCMGILARQRRLRRIVFPTMTKQAWQARVIAIVVFELRVVSRRLLQHCMSKNSSITRHRGRLRNRVKVTGRHRSPAKCEMALRASERGAFSSLIDLVIEDATIIEGCSNVTTFGATA